MDYKGQKLAEYIFYVITILFSFVAWIIGYFKDDFKFAVYGWFAGLVLSLLICIPDWPFYNRHPVEWLSKVGQYLRVPQSTKATTNTQPVNLKQKGRKN